MFFVYIYYRYIFGDFIQFINYYLLLFLYIVIYLTAKCLVTNFTKLQDGWILPRKVNKVFHWTGLPSSNVEVAALCSDNDCIRHYIGS